MVSVEPSPGPPGGPWLDAAKDTYRDENGEVGVRSVSIGVPRDEDGAELAWLEAEEAGGRVVADELDGRARVLAHLRDMWQQWPKSLEISADELAVGLFPAFDEGDFSHMEPWYKHQYLFDGSCYQLRTGQARKWDVWVDLGGNGKWLAREANKPLLPTADPAQAIASALCSASTPSVPRILLVVWLNSPNSRIPTATSMACAPGPACESASVSSANGSPPKAKSVGAACTRGATCSTSSRPSTCPAWGGS